MDTSTSLIERGTAPVAEVRLEPVAEEAGRRLALAMSAVHAVAR